MASVLTALSLMLGGLGCHKEKKTAIAREQGILLINNGVEPEDLDPQTATGVSEHSIFLAIYEGLVSEDPHDLHPVPGVAESWDISPDGLVYTFHLRHDAKWSNGDPVTAQDFYDSYQRILTPELGSDYIYMHFFTKNAEAYATGKIKDFSQVGYRVIDPQTFEITLTTATPFFLSVMNHASWYPVHIPTVKKFGGLARKAAFWTKAENCVTNGAFTLKDWKQQSIIRCVKSPNYWDAKTVKLNEIDFYPIESSNTEERAFRAGQLHKTNELPLSKIPWYQQNRPDLLRQEPYLGTYFFRVNTHKPPLDNIKVRLALAMSIDRKMIVEKITRGGQLPADSFTPPGTAGYTAEAKIPFDVAKARQLLAEAGYPDGRGFPKLDILFNTVESHRTIAEAVQEMWKNNLHIDVGLSNQEWKVYLAAQDTENYQICRAGWIGDYADPQNFLDMWVKDGGNNHTGWDNSEYNGLYAKLQNTSIPADRLAIFQKMEALLMAEAPILPVYWYTRVYLIRPEVQGWYPNILDHHPYKYVYFADQKPEARH